MTEIYSRAETIARVDLLTEARLDKFLRADVITPVHVADGIAFRTVDLVRMELMCELTEHFDIAEDALGIVMSLIDQLHATRSDLQAVMSVLENEEDDVRARVIGALARTRAGG